LRQVPDAQALLAAALYGNPAAVRALLQMRAMGLIS